MTVSRPTRATDGVFVLSSIVTLLLAVAGLGWALMIAVGIASSFHVVGGTLPFWDALAVALLLRVAVTFDSGTVRR